MQNYFEASCNFRRTELVSVSHNIYEISNTFLLI